MSDIKEIPRHVAVIPDGNRRWARERNLDPWAGHDKGAQKIEEITRKSHDLNIKYLSLWGSSSENLQKRSVTERKELLKVYEKYFKKIISSDEIFENEVRINVFGEWEKQLPSSLTSLIKDGVNKTQNHTRFYLNFFLAYSGDEEMLSAVRAIANSGLSGEEITKDTIKQNLLTSELPAVDYLIRTGGEPHLSAGFMMWDIANAQLFFSDKYFPEFGANEFEYAIEDYSRRVRRLGA